jgi:hypothetical protein
MNIKKIGAADSSEMLLIYQTTRHDIQENCNINTIASQKPPVLVLENGLS